MDKQKARVKIADFIFDCGYTYAVDDIIEYYLKYYKKGYYVSHSMRDCIKNLKVELEVLTNT